jgi:hypothetical protein
MERAGHEEESRILVDSKNDTGMCDVHDF